MYKALLFILLFIAGGAAFAQKQILIKGSESITGSRIKNAVNIKKPVFQQDNAVLTCDSAILYQDRNVFDAFGNVHINQADTVNIYSNRLTYDGNSKHAHLEGNVSLIQGSSVLTTNVLDYDMLPKIGTYVNGGKITSRDVVITSRNGYYFANSADSYFRYNVVATTPSAVITGDTLRYNSMTKWVYFYGPTNIKGKDDNLYTENGAYNTMTEQAFFGKKNLYTQGSKTMRGDSLYYDGRQGYGRAVGNIYFHDAADKTLLRGQLGQYWKGSQHTMVTQNAYIGLATNDSVTVGKIKRPDSLWIGADTLETQMTARSSVNLLPRISVKSNNELVASGGQRANTGLANTTAATTTAAGSAGTAGADNTAAGADKTAAQPAAGNAAAVPPANTTIPGRITEPAKAPAGKVQAKQTGGKKEPPKTAANVQPANNSYTVTDIAGTPAAEESLRPNPYDIKTKGKVPLPTDSTNTDSIKKTAAAAAVKKPVAKPVLKKTLPPALTPQQRAVQDSLLALQYAKSNNPFGVNSNGTAITPYLNTPAVQPVAPAAAAAIGKATPADSSARPALSPADSARIKQPLAIKGAERDPSGIRPILDDKGRQLIKDTQMRTAGRRPAGSAYAAASANAAENIRIISAYRRVKVYKSNAQAVADSLFYTPGDSTLRCYKKPILWSENSQVSGDTIYVQLKNKKLDMAQVIENAFLINTQPDTARYNQIKGKVLTAFFANGSISTVYDDGNAESIYYNQNDKTKAFTEMSQTVGSRLKINFKDKQVDRIVNITKVEGVVYPDKQIPAEAKLNGYNWQPDKRPKSKADATIYRTAAPRARAAGKNAPAVKRSAVPTAGSVRRTVNQVKATAAGATTTAPAAAAGAATGARPDTTAKK